MDREGFLIHVMKMPKQPANSILATTGLPIHLRVFCVRIIDAFKYRENKPF